MSPDINLNIVELFKINFPINELLAPKLINTKEKPKVNKTIGKSLIFFLF